MKKIISVFLIFAAVFLYSVVPMVAVGASGADEECTSSDADACSVITDLNEYKNTDILILYRNGDVEVVPYKDEAELAAKIAKAAADPEVEVVQPDYDYVPCSLTNDTYSKYQWGLYNDGSTLLANYLAKYGSGGKQVKVAEGMDVNIIPAWDLCDRGKKAETIIALVDTGVQLNHPDFNENCFWVNKDEIPENGVDDDNNGYIDDVNGWNFYDDGANVSYGNDNAHGTHNAGTMVAVRNNGEGVAGIASAANVKVMVLKTLGSDNQTGKTSHIVKAIKYAENKGATVCNMSIGTFTYDPVLYKAMSESDMLFVVAAGNYSTNCDEKPAYPGNYDLDNIISVANLQPDGTISAQSNYGANSVEIAAPGTYIVSTGQKSKYSMMTGTSMAAPVVSAVAAMIHSYNPDLGATDIRSIILETARYLPTLDGKVMTGMVDAGAAMEKAAMPLRDVYPGDSYYMAVTFLYKNGFMIGTSATQFSPGDTLTRAMVITILGRIAGAEQVDTRDYSDVENGSWYSGYVGWATNNGIVIGYGGGKFGPYDKVKAYQLDLMISRYAANLGIEYSTGLTGERYLTRGETAETIYDFMKILIDNQ